MAVAMRVGTALRLGQEDEGNFDPFHLEIRRRLWYSIALLDTFSSLDRGTAALIHWDDLGPAPLIINDNEMSLGSLPKLFSPGFNDMSFFGLMFRAMACHKKMVSIPDSADGGWTARLQLVMTFERAVKEDYIDINEDAQPLEKFAAQAAISLITAMHLILRRPPYKQAFKAVPITDDFNVLEHSSKVLRYELGTKSPEFAPWAWKSWVQWYALAIVLAELCNQPPGEAYDAAYAVAIRSFRHYSSSIADNDTGMLWKPIAKLMRRVQLQMRHRSPVLSPSNNVPLTSECVSDESSNLDYASVPRCDHPAIIYSDSDFNWSMFLDEVNFGSSLDLEDSSFGNMSIYDQEYNDGEEI